MKIAFISMSALLDPSNGAAQSVRTMLEHAATLGHSVTSITGATFDSPPANQVEDILKIAAINDIRHNDNHIVVQYRNIEHRLVPVPTLTRMKATRNMEGAVFNQVKSFLSDTKPDIILTFGGGLLNDGLKAEAKRLNIPLVMYLANPSYTKKEYFENYAAIVTDTEATRKLYFERFGLHSYVIGKFIEFSVSENAVGERGMVTFINPIPEKGATLFFRIAQLAETALPDVRFLVVESRGRLDALDEKLGINFSSLRNIRTIGLLKDLKSVFDLTRLLLVPSLWHDSGPRIIVEAMARGIPIIAHDVGGISELAGEAGVYLDAPADLLKNCRLIPSPTSAIPWIEAIRIMLKEKNLYDQYRAVALKNAELHDPKKNIDRVLDIFRSLLKA